MEGTLEFNIEEIRARLDCREVFAALTGQRPIARGPIWHLYRRPGDEDRNASFGVRTSGAKDFANDQWFDLFDLLRLLEQLPDFPSAVRRAAELAGYSELPTTKNPTNQPAIRPAAVVSVPPSEAYCQAAEIEVRRAEAFLAGSTAMAAQIRQWLVVERGIDMNIARRFRLGYNPEWRQTECRVCDDRGTERRAWLPPGLVIPCFAEGQFQYIKVRRVIGSLAEALGKLQEVQTRWDSGLGRRVPVVDKQGKTEIVPKYTFLAGGFSSALFNSDKLVDRLRPAFFLEGELDVIVCERLAGDMVSPVTFGSASYGPDGLSDVIRQRLKVLPRLTICMDMDKAGQTASKKLVEGLALIVGELPIFTLGVPIGKDLSEYATVHHGNVRRWLLEVLCPRWGTELPDAVRSAVLASRTPHASILCRLFSRVFPDGWSTPGKEYFTIEGLLDYCQWEGIDMAEHTLRRAIAEDIEDEDGFLAKCDRDSQVVSSLLPFVGNVAGGVGRRSIGYTFRRTFTSWLAAQRRQAEERLISRAIVGCLREPDAASVQRADPDDPLPGETARLVCNDIDVRRYYERQERWLAERLETEQIALDQAWKSQKSSHLGDSDWTTLHDYRAVFLASIVNAEGGECRMSRVQIATLIGVHSSRVGPFLASAGLISEIQDAMLVRVTASTASGSFTGRPLFMTASFKGGRTERTPYMRAVAGKLAASWMKAGADVFVVVQPPNILRQGTKVEREARAAQAHEPQLVHPPRWHGAGLFIKLLERAKGLYLRGDSIFDPLTGEIIARISHARDLIKLLQRENAKDYSISMVA